MHECSPRCPTVRRQLREYVKKAGWTNEYLRTVIDVHRADIAQNLERGLARKVKPDPRKKPLGPRKRVKQKLAIDHDDRYEKVRQQDRSEPGSRDLVRVTDYEEPIEDFDETQDEFEAPVASLHEESIYYTEEKQIAHVTPFRRITPKVSPQSTRVVPSKASKTRTPKASSREIGPPITGGEIIVYGRGEVADTAVPYRKEADVKLPVREIPHRNIADRKIADRKIVDRKIADREIADYEVAPHDVTYSKIPDRKVLDRNDGRMTDQEMPGPSRIMDNKGTVKNRDASPDNYYNYTPKELRSHWPHDGCEETCPARKIKERAEKLSQGEENKEKRICTCSLRCMVHNLGTDPFVRSILTSAMLFAVGIKLCSELHGWYLPSRA